MTRTEEDRNRIIENKVSQIMTNIEIYRSHTKTEEIYQDNEKPLSFTLRELRQADAPLFRRSSLFENDQEFRNITIIETDMGGPPGCLLRDWSSIPGRETTPPPLTTSSEFSNIRVIETDVGGPPGSLLRDWSNIPGRETTPPLITSSELKEFSTNFNSSLLNISSTPPIPIKPSTDKSLCPYSSEVPLSINSVSPLFPNPPISPELFSDDDLIYHSVPKEANDQIVHYESFKCSDKDIVCFDLTQSSDSLELNEIENNSVDLSKSPERSETPVLVSISPVRSNSVNNSSESLMTPIKSFSNNLHNVIDLSISPERFNISNNSSSTNSCTTPTKSSNISPIYLNTSSVNENTSIECSIEKAVSPTSSPEKHLDCSQITDEELNYSSYISAKHCIQISSDSEDGNLPDEYPEADESLELKPLINKNISNDGSPGGAVEKPGSPSSPEQQLGCSINDEEHNYLSYISAKHSIQISSDSEQENLSNEYPKELEESLELRTLTPNFELDLSNEIPDEFMREESPIVLKKLEHAPICSPNKKIVDKDCEVLRKQKSNTPDNSLSIKTKNVTPMANEYLEAHDESLELRPLTPDFELDLLNHQVTIPDEFTREESPKIFKKLEHICSPNKKLVGKNSEVLRKQKNNTPDNSLVIIKTKNVTPMANYSEMDTPERIKELDKYGLKRMNRAKS